MIGPAEFSRLCIADEFESNATLGFGPKGCSVELLFHRHLISCQYSKEIINSIFSNNRLGENCLLFVRVNKEFNRVLSNPDLWRQIFDREGLRYFDDKKCRKYRGNPGDVPFLSWPKAYKYFYSECLLFPGKLVKDTQKLQFFYKEIDEISTTLNRVGELAQCPKEDSNGVTACFAKYCWGRAFKVHGEAPINKSFWGFVTVIPLDGSTEIELEEKLTLVLKHPDYRLHRIVERSVANFDNVVETGKYLDAEDSWVLCEEVVTHDFGSGENSYRLGVGGAQGPVGLYVLDCHGGVVLLREF